MKLAAKSVLWLLPLLLTACFHKTNRPQAQSLAPPLGATTQPKPAAASVELPNSALTIPNEPAAPSAQAKGTAKPPVKHRKPAAKPVQQAANPNPGVSAIGQLSSGDAPDVRRQALDSIAATERGLNGIGRKLNDQELKTAGQIR
jgi:hypothetical protein